MVGFIKAHNKVKKKNIENKKKIWGFSIWFETKGKRKTSTIANFLFEKTKKQVENIKL